MKFIVAAIAFCAVVVLATASPKPIFAPYGPQGIYGGGGASAYNVADGAPGLYGNYGGGIVPGYGGYAPGYGGYAPNYGGYLSAYPF